MIKGRVIKNYNGYYYVDIGEHDLVECRRRGKLKQKILVGDELMITLLGSYKGIIEQLLLRRNSIRRPAVANIDEMFVIMAAKSPDPNRFLIDKILMTCEYGGIHPKLCFNKCDLDRAAAEAYHDFYTRCGYEVYLVSAKTGEGIAAIQALLTHRMTAFSGPSGVGKSSLLSRILNRDDLSIGSISNKIQRGRHTTRHSEIMKLDRDTYVVDTPGFSSLDFEHLQPRDVLSLLPDMASCGGICRFSSCLHLSEPGCAVKTAVAEGKIQKERYETYCKIISSIAERKR
ncbi:ribosome small subunit-dependent GTPase [Megasphaera cerevisiae DSM 20462]|jgi:ribosome biogenesis GTPase|uniref:Small ribosomal subunit biogenesis GTPase RsgA n=1 Tax=Megasphaera cerevisiae DSM 20462 TaxID=1122219 RepID=A0A0J6WZ31_9FIRM|nr:ribosome small subunit-dependent GTPase A [Megasphaera cerevisiae]KMO87914.1 ribosome small subunit-dependent GTPase [Megasphaera cerevisiae DSM 20462]OKY53649.1 ribosome small subunit-dependent GTPase A [Megasphaera cerevisiae]SJZ43446.1 ribosome biogenesis GTPase [Megasphaera cerevisiae DSM 20462]